MNKEIVLKKLNEIFSETGAGVGMTQEDRAVELITGGVFVLLLRRVSLRS